MREREIEMERKGQINIEMARKILRPRRVPVNGFAQGLEEERKGEEKGGGEVGDMGNRKCIRDLES